MRLLETITDLERGRELLRRGRYGVIETHAGRFVSLRLRPFPKIISAAEVATLGRWFHARRAGDRCLLYYNQPRSCPTFLALKYVLSTHDCRAATFIAALAALDEIARVKRSDAIVCDVWNSRISDRFLARYGWEAHCPSRRRRHFIKRFYGERTQSATGFASAVFSSE